MGDWWSPPTKVGFGDGLGIGMIYLSSGHTIRTIFHVEKWFLAQVVREINDIKLTRYACYQYSPNINGV